MAHVNGKIYIGTEWLWIRCEADALLWQEHKTIPRAEESSVKEMRAAFLLTCQGTWILVFFVYISSLVSLKHVRSIARVFLHFCWFTGGYNSELLNVWCLVWFLLIVNENSEKCLSSCTQTSPSLLHWCFLTAQQSFHTPKLINSTLGLQNLGSCLPGDCALGSIFIFQWLVSNCWKYCFYLCNIEHQERTYVLVLV